MDMLSSTMIGSKTQLDIWSCGAAQDYALLRVIGSPTHFSVKDD